MAETAPSEIVTLAIDGTRYQGWTSVRISRALDTLSGEFELGLTDREKLGADRLKLRAGSACEILVGGETLITGWIDRIGPNLNADSHGLTVSGRDKSADLIDCSADVKPGSWKNVSLETIASQIAAPFGITVTAKAQTGPNIRRFALQQGETVFGAIERLCRFRGLLPITTRDGNVELITPASGAPVATIIEGVNAKDLSATHDMADRYSDYIVKGQSSGNDEVHGKAASAPVGRASDPGVKRHRPLILIGEEQGDHASLTRRAQWEATTRAARAQEASAELVGWRRGDGQLWDRNMVATLAAPSIYIDAPMLVVSASLIKDERGTVTELRLSPPEAYSQLAIPEEADASSVKKRKAA